MRHTIVCFHAHPDDEALLMGGTMARLSAEGHRVVLVTATAGEGGLASSQLAAQQPLGERRSEELAASAEALGCARTVMLGFADSGMADHANNSVQAFAQTPVSTAAVGLARLLSDEAAAVLTIYDPVGGYGHPDHVQVHRVGRHAAELAGTPVVLEATVDRRVLQHALRVVRPFTRGSADLKPARFRELFSDPSRITHRVDVSGFLDHKRAAMQAHASQMTADGDARILARLLQLPDRLFRVAMGREWFVERGRIPTRRPLDDVLATLRQPS